MLFRNMKYIIVFSFLLLFKVCPAQTVANHYQTAKFDVAIFPKDFPDAMNIFVTAYTPTTAEVDSMEMALYNASSFTFDWLNTQVIVFDGGSTYWSVHYNYTKKGFYNLSINGSG